MEPITRLECLVLARDTFVAILGPLEALMAREKSVAVVSQRLARLQTKGGGTPHMPAEVLIKRRKRARAGGDGWEVVRARGHLDEVQALRSFAQGARPRCAHGAARGLVAASSVWASGQCAFTYFG